MYPWTGRTCRSRSTTPTRDAEAEDDADCSPLALLPLVQQPSLSPRTTADPRVPSVQRPLASHLHSVEDLVGHIRRLDESQSGTAIALGEVWHKRSEVDLDNVLNPQTYVSPEHQLLYANATYEVYDVGPDALAVQQHDAHGNDNDQTLEAATVWNTLKVRALPRVVRSDTNRPSRM